MNYTSNHHLPQWSASDRVRMEDFNAAMSSIEAGLNGNSNKADAAQSTANEAKAAAASAAKPYVVGSYTGTGKNITVTLGFQPSFLIISGMKQTKDEDSDTEFTRYFALTGGNGGGIRGRVELIPSGFAVYYANNAGLYWPMLTDAGRTYYYIAFR